MSREERQGLREDLNATRREYYRRGDPDGGDRGRPHQRLSPEERSKLRQDIQDANRHMRGRR